VRAALIKISRVLGALVLLATGVLTVLYLRVDLPGDAMLPSGDRRNTAQYVTMRDGVRLAVDVWLPEQFESGVTLPTAMKATRYWRATAIGPLRRLMMALGQAHPAATVPGDVRSFNAEGYAVVLVDVRGSGASFGERPSEFGREEALDLGEVADWISQKAWSNGRVGTWGVSYEGNTAAMAAVGGSPALTAIAPQYADFDAQAQLVWPGGVFAGGFIRDWGALVGAMDRNEICTLAGAQGLSCLLVRLSAPGVKPVDGGSRLLEEAVAGHRTPDVGAGAELLEFKDDTWGETGNTMTEVSIHGYESDIERSGVAIYSWAGWMDAGTVDGALALFSTFANPVRLSVGPWSHGGGFNTDPFLPDDAPTDPSRGDQQRMLFDFFDHYVRQDAAEQGQGVGEISYYTFGEGWRTSISWPPAGMTSTRWYFGPDGTLTLTPPEAVGVSDEYSVDFSHTTGGATRWHTQLGGNDVVYGDRSGEDEKLLTFTSDPLEQDVEITGTVEVDLLVASSVTGGAFFGYLEVVGPDGTSRYVTEGQLRALHRKECVADPPYPVWGPCHTFDRADALPLVPGEVANVRFGFYNTSVLVPAGHRIRIALGGHDGSVFDRYPAEGQPVWTVQRSAAQPSGVVIPMRYR
jgi:putative CocE/NonD family hydrolase